LAAQKYKLEYKLEIVKKVLENGRQAGTIAREYQVSKGDVQKWVAAYKEHGIDGLQRNRLKYTGEFKRKVIEDMHEDRLSLRQASAKYNIGTHYTLSNWERIYYEKGPEALYEDRRGKGQKNRSGRPPKLDIKTEGDLIAENQRLRAEIDYLKNLNALVSERVQREKKQKS